MIGAVQRTLVEPACDRWATLAERSFASMDDRSHRFRTDLGLPADRPIVMTGHQAEWWHCGVLAKFLAVDAACRRFSMSPAWTVPDQDEAGYAQLRVPITTATSRLRAATIELTTPPPPGVCSAAAAAFSPSASWPSGGAPALESVRRGVDRLAEALQSHRDAPSAARQVLGAITDLLSPLRVQAPAVFATALAGTDAFRSLVDRLRTDPRRASECYNRAVAANPGAGVTPLVVDGRRVELPLWLIRPDGTRQRVFASDLDAHTPPRLAPRALVLTGMLRWGACDLFVHGTGGAVYDPIAEQWLGDWLGASLAPMATVTADVLLPLPGAEISDAEAAKAIWGAHGSRHNPALVSDQAGQLLKRDLLAAVDAAPRRSARRAEAFRSLHGMLAAHRKANAQRIAALDDRAGRMRSALSDRAVARDRTWAFFLHEPAALEVLRDRIAESCGAAQPCGC